MKPLLHVVLCICLLDFRVANNHESDLKFDRKSLKSRTGAPQVSSMKIQPQAVATLSPIPKGSGPS
jgi:hypothetical protein